MEDDLPEPITDEVLGKYLYKYSTGQVEALSLKSDSTYEQLVYLNESNYLNEGKPILTNNSKWSVSGKDIRFENWLMCSDFGLSFDTVKYQPNLSGYSGVFWRKPNKYRKDYKLYFYYENGYVFTKQKDSIPIYHDRNSR
ncbi:MAG: hypothetical protein IM600_15945 [Bacteroidetes bacterium]|nr:hypothetical protein [Bacteroidota bacterium]